MKRRGLFFVLLLFMAVSGRAEASAQLLKEEIARALPAGLSIAELDVPKKLGAVRAQSVSIGWRGAPRAGSTAVDVTLVDRTGREHRGFVRVKLIELGRALVTTRDLEKGAHIQEGDLLLSEVPVTRGALDLAPEALLGQPLRARVPAGAVLLETQVELPPFIRRGSELTVLLQNGGLTVKMRGTLERDARVGQPARARVPAIKSAIAGRLLDEHTFAVDGGSR